MPISRTHAQSLDAADPLARFRHEFVITDPNLLYLDGNSLGRLTRRGAAAVERALHAEWGDRLVRSWHDWIGLCEAGGAALAPLIGAKPHEVLVCDQTSLNLYKLATAALRAAEAGRRDIVADDSNFPSDRYVLRSVAEAAGGSLRELQVSPIDGPTPADLAPALDGKVALVSHSVVAFKSGAIADVVAITEQAHEHGALTLWDLSHAAGAIPVDLNAAGADLAVGCTYKYLNGGPGAPAFLYVREDLQERLMSPIPGWFGHDDMFAFEAGFRPAPGIRRFAIGTPPILSLRGTLAGISITAEAGIEALRDKSVLLTELFLELSEQRLVEHGFEVASPRDATRRGSHVSLAHPQGYAITQALIAAGVIPDFRTPDSIRFGLAPLYNSYVEVFDAVDRLAAIMTDATWREFAGGARERVT